MLYSSYFAGLWFPFIFQRLLTSHHTDVDKYCIHDSVFYLLFDYFLREIFPEGLPPSYVFVATVRLKGSAKQDKFDLLRILSKDGVTQAAVTLNGADKSVTFTTTSTTNEKQLVTFNH